MCGIDNKLTICISFIAILNIGQKESFAATAKQEITQIPANVLVRVEAVTSTIDSGGIAEGKNGGGIIQQATAIQTFLAEIKPVDYDGKENSRCYLVSITDATQVLIVGENKHKLPYHPESFFLVEKAIKSNNLSGFLWADDGLWMVKEDTEDGHESKALINDFIRRMADLACVPVSEDAIPFKSDRQWKLPVKGGDWVTHSSVFNSPSVEVWPDGKAKIVIEALSQSQETAELPGFKRDLHWVLYGNPPRLTRSWDETTQTLKGKNITHQKRYMKVIQPHEITTDLLFVENGYFHKE